MNGEQTRGNTGGAEFALPPITAAAHELKTPLVLIRQLSLMLQAGELDHNNLQKIAQRLELTSERALRLADDLTQTERLQNTLFELEPINPLALCDEVATELRPLYQAHERQIQSEHRRRAPLVIANHALLRRVLVNFADNALYHSDQSAPVQLTARVYRDRVRISVRDHGPGVSSRLWQSLKQGNAAIEHHARRPRSSGLGLYIAQQSAAAMNGRVGVVRHRDGASFFVELNCSTQLSLL